MRNRRLAVLVLALYSSSRGGTGDLGGLDIAVHVIQ